MPEDCYRKCRKDCLIAPAGHIKTVVLVQGCIAEQLCSASITQAKCPNAAACCHPQESTTGLTEEACRCGGGANSSQLSYLQHQIGRRQNETTLLALLRITHFCTNTPAGNVSMKHTWLEQGLPSTR